MSLVGPRPLPLRDYERLEGWHRKRYLVLPGDDRPLADLGPLEPRLRRPRPARLLLPRELVDLARHLDPARRPCPRCCAAGAPTDVERVLVTGPAGFVGGHLRAELGEAFVPVRGRRARRGSAARGRSRRAPDAVVHLAAESSVAASWEDAFRAWRVNVDGTVNVLEAVRARGARGARAVRVDLRGLRQRDAGSRLRRTSRSRPLSPYAASKAAAELACAVSGARRRRRAAPRTTRARAATSASRSAPGRGRSRGWRPRAAARLLVGDLSAERDLLDVRDVCRAYRLLLDRSVPAGTYNVASGRTVHDGARRRAAGRRSRACRCRSSATRARVRPADDPAARRRPVAACGPRPAGSPRSRSSRRSPTRSSAARELEPVA